MPGAYRAGRRGEGDEGPLGGGVAPVQPDTCVDLECSALRARDEQFRAGRRRRPGVRIDEPVVTAIARQRREPHTRRELEGDRRERHAVEDGEIIDIRGVFDIAPVDRPEISLRDRICAFHVDVAERQFRCGMAVSNRETFVPTAMIGIGDQGQDRRQFLAERVLQSGSVVRGMKPKRRRQIGNV